MSAVRRLLQNWANFRGLEIHRSLYEIDEQTARLEDGIKILIRL